MTHLLEFEDENTGIVILGNDDAGYSIFPNMESTKGEGAFKNAYKDTGMYSLGMKSTSTTNSRR